LTIKSAQHTKNSRQSTVHSLKFRTPLFAFDFQLSTVNCSPRRFAFLPRPDPIPSGEQMPIFSFQPPISPENWLLPTDNCKLPGKRHTIQFSKIVEYPQSILVSRDLIPAWPLSRAAAFGCWG
jgi:hypothetical protein